MKDEDYLSRCAQLASLGDSRVLDNPRVGAVLVYKDRIIGEGFHKQAGQAHAEVNCLRSVAENDKVYIPEATLYVSLEPCYITGRTGACVNLIQQHGIKRVVFAQRDTTNGAGGESVHLLKNAGVDVREYPDFTPTLAPNAHRRVFTQKGRPYIILKYAQSSDGFLRPANRRQAYWITNPISRRLVHRWRANTAAIVVGGATIVDDNPSLTTRLFPGPDARAVILDPRDRCTGKEQIFHRVGVPPLLFSGTQRSGLHAEVVVTGPELDKGALTQVLGKLYEQRYGQITVEGGAGILNAFLQAGLWDEIRVFTSSHRLGEGLPAPAIPVSARLADYQSISNDQLFIYK